MGKRTITVMTQPRHGKILSALGLNKAPTDLCLGCPYTPKRVLPIKVCVTLHYIIYLKMLKRTVTLNINTNFKSLAQSNKNFLTEK